MLALPALSVLAPQLSSDVFRMEVKLGRYAVSALHSRAMQRLDATVAVMKHSLDAQLVVRCRQPQIRAATSKSHSTHRTCCLHCGIRDLSPNLYERRCYACGGVDASKPAGN